MKLNLKEENLIGAGAFQKVYFHPNNNQRCIKVEINQEQSDIRVQRELKYYRYIQKRKKNTYEYSFFAKYYGLVDTNLGVGYEYDLIRDEISGEVSIPLSRYLGLSKKPFPTEIMCKELLRLRKQMILHKIIARDLTDKNICCKILKNKEVRLVVVDGMGHRDFFRLVDWFTFFTKRKIDRIFKRKLHMTNKYCRNIQY